jgi:hypothetical protein
MRDTCILLLVLGVSVANVGGMFQRDCDDKRLLKNLERLVREIGWAYKDVSGDADAMLAKIVDVRSIVAGQGPLFHRHEDAVNGLVAELQSKERSWRVKQWLEQHVQSCCDPVRQCVSHDECVSHDGAASY